MDLISTLTNISHSHSLSKIDHDGYGVDVFKDVVTCTGNLDSSSIDPNAEDTRFAPGNSLLIYILNGAVIPVISVFGVIGNLLNLVILSARYSKREVDVLERGALAVLIALAMSDTFFCCCILPYAKYSQVNTAVFYIKDFEYYFKNYGLYFQNVFIKVSTWLTCVVGLARYVGICHPLRARIFIGLCGIRTAIVISYVAWLLMMIPLLFNFHVHEFPITNVTSMYIMDVGPFMANKSLKTGVSYVWFILGYFLPVVVLGFCNTRLIFALRQSLQLRKQTSSFSDGLRRQRDLSNRITLTLVAVILSCMILVSPSEILYFYSEMMDAESYESFEVALTLANVLQAINVSFHFVLYCTVNATFRRTIVNFVYTVKTLANGKRQTKNHSRSDHCYSRRSGFDADIHKVNTGFSTNISVTETTV